MLTGLKFRNFTNPQGALADGTCCDNPGLTPPNCPPDQCDTIFLPCATYVGGKQCGAYYQTPTPPMADVDSFQLGNKIGNIKGDDIANVVAFLDSFAPENIHFNILALEVTLNNTQLIANFSFVIDWIDTFFSINDHWRQMVLRDKDVELGLDVVHQCRIYRFGPTCSVYCKPTHQYTCLNDGSKNCTDGWQGPDCTDLVPYCTSSSCLNGGTCTNIHLGFNCSCTSSYSGKQCEHKDLTTTTSSSLISLIIAPSTSTSKPSTSSKGRRSKTPISNQTNLSKRRDLISLMAISVSVWLFVLGVLFATAAYLLNKIKKQRFRGRVQPSLSPHRPGRNIL